MEQQRKSQAAEEAYVAKHVWNQQDGGDEEMGDNIYLGDIKEETIHTVGAGVGGLAKGLIVASALTAGLGAMAAGVGAAFAIPIAAYYLTKPDSEEVVDTDTNTKYGLGIFREDKGQQ